MENYKGQEQSNMNSINIKNGFNNQFSSKILRTKSKNIYIQPKNNKSKEISNAYIKPKLSKNNNNNMNNINNKPDINYKNSNIRNNINKQIQNNNNNNNQNDNYKTKASDLYQIKILKEERKKLLSESKHQDVIIKELYNSFIHNYNKINALKKKYSHLKKYLKNSLLDDGQDKLLKEKMEEEYALRAVEQQIMNEICPNPDIMSYEQLLELEEGLGSVNKGLSKDKISKIPLKPFRKALFEDNSNCIICMELFNENELVKQLPCGHIFHGECIDQWLGEQKNCPFCKAECNCNY